MPRNQQEFDLDPGRYREDDGHVLPREPEDMDSILEPERSVARRLAHHVDDEAEEAEIAEEDILEIADLEDEMDARKGDGPDA